MGITFLKSILGNRKNKNKNSPHGKPVDLETRSFHDDQANEEAFDAVEPWRTLPALRDGLF